MSEMLDALREIYDGKWVRHLGTDGGKTLNWEGKLGLIFGCTEAYDSHYAVIGALGDQFLLYRLPTSRAGQFERAMLHTGDRFKLMQDELAAAAAGLFAGLGDPLPTPRPMTEEESLRIKRTSFSLANWAPASIATATPANSKPSMALRDQAASASASNGSSPDSTSSASTARPRSQSSTRRRSIPSRQSD